MAQFEAERRIVPVPITGGLSEIDHPVRLPPGELTVAQNAMFRRFQTVGKRTGSGPYAGTGVVPGNLPVVSGVRWYRGRPSNLTQMVVQSNDRLFSGNDATGVFTQIGSPLTAGTTPAFFASAYDPAITSDILITAYGSGPPMKYDGATLSQLNASITNNFTGCVFWHEHVWFWGDPAFPDTMFATNLGTPESMSFVNVFGGYQIGRGDGDRTIQSVMPVGDKLYIFKTNSIYVIEGYDFTTGEYQFVVRPIIQGIGTTSPHSLGRIRDSILFWSGSQFYMLTGEQATPFGTRIINEMSQAALYNQSLMRATAGSFNVASANNPTVYMDLYMCAFDSGSGIADTIAVYDDLATQERQKPMWSIWKGLNIGSFIPWQGPGDKKYLYFGNANNGAVNLLGQNATNDSGAPIAFQVATGRLDCGSPDNLKKLERIYLDVEAGAAAFSITIQSEDPLSPTISLNANSVAVAGGIWGTSTWGVDVFGAASNTVFQSIIADVQAFFRGKNFTITISESSTTATYELVGLNLNILEEALQR